MLINTLKAIKSALMGLHEQDVTLALKLVLFDAGAADCAGCCAVAKASLPTMPILSDFYASTYGMQGASCWLWRSRPEERPQRCAGMCTGLPVRWTLNCVVVCRCCNLCWTLCAQKPSTLPRCSCSDHTRLARSGSSWRLLASLSARYGPNISNTSLIAAGM